MLDKSLYQKLIEFMPVGVVLADSNGGLLFVNEQAGIIFGCEQREITERMPWIIHPNDFADSEHSIVTKSGAENWVSHSWSQISDDKSNLILSIIRDITDQKQAEEHQKKVLRNVSHEIRTPLTAVMGYAEMLLEGVAGEVSDEQAVLLDKVLTSSNHLLDVVNGILQTARLQNGLTLLNPKICSPQRILERSISTVLPQAQHKDIAINILSDSAECLGMYDEEKLVIILTNLLTNAVKYTEAGSIDVTITCAASGVEIIVTDTGFGMNSADLPSIFDEFQQLDHSRKHRIGGFGVGLAIVAIMVEAIGANLTVSSEQGIGTAFTLFAPILEA